VGGFKLRVEVPRLGPPNLVEFLSSAIATFSVVVCVCGTDIAPYPQLSSFTDRVQPPRLEVREWSSER